jgi:hypothetical protein
MKVKMHSNEIKNFFEKNEIEKAVVRMKKMKHICSILIVKIKKKIV